METLLNVSPVHVVAMLLGVLLIKLLSFHRKKIKYKRMKGIKLKFSFKTWVDDNLIQVLLSLVIGFTAILLKDDIFSLFSLDIKIDSEFNTAHAFLCGFLSDVILEYLVNLRLRKKKDDNSDSDSTTDDTAESSSKKEPIV